MKHTSRIAMVLVCFWITDLPAQVRDGIGAQDLPLTSTGNLRFLWICRLFEVLRIYPTGGGTVAGCESTRAPGTGG